MATQIVVGALHPGTTELRVTPIIGVSDVRDSASGEALWEHARQAREYAETQLDLRPVVWDEQIERWASTRSERKAGGILRVAAAILRRYSLVGEILLTYVVGLLLPFFAYVAAYRAGFDITMGVYLAVVIALVVTGALIWIEGILAFRRTVPPDAPAEPYPPATAVIAAYLPNEAATIVETLQAFLSLEYPAPLQIILAYNTPKALPVERDLIRLAGEHPGLQLVRVDHSTSKAQNVNAALQHVRGAFGT
jgi:hypothetical protein